MSTPYPDWFPKIEITGPRRVRLLEDLIYKWVDEDGVKHRLIIPAGFECDGGSVPKILHWYIGWDELLPAAIPHDWFYAFSGIVPLWSHMILDEADQTWKPADQRWTRKEADEFFARLLPYCGELNSVERHHAYLAVRVGGFRAWRKQTWRPSEELL